MLVILSVSIILSLIGTIFLTYPLVRQRTDRDDNLIIKKNGYPKPGENQNRYWSSAGFLRDRKCGLIGLCFIAVGYFVQVFITFYPDFFNSIGDMINYFFIAYNINLINTSGLALNMAGVVILYIYGLPSKIYTPPKLLLELGLTGMELNENKRIIFRARIGLNLIIAGLVSQIIGQWIK